MLIRNLNEYNLYPKGIAETSSLKNISTLRIHMFLFTKRIEIRKNEDADSEPKRR